ncbi:Putative ribonuclease H protein [Dendrobium catenatum]|uniref:Ribonuclease H protein n=1 Tax=Dendrobium catenatum TaxID=906689 RepID=A0A2I0XH01_9ASPA|nr:Putative ribonuclease H protein [Dendrobium catenatum]
MYADDLLLFGRADTHNCGIIRKLLDKFSAASGLEINFKKSSIILPANYHYADNISYIFNIPHTSCINYLGIPLSPYNPKISDFACLTETINHKLAGWKAKSLSFADRLQFLRFTIWNSIAYWICGSIIPKTIIKKIEKHCAKFLYFGETDSHKLQLISWRNTCKPKIFGGLGIPSLHAVQFSYSCALIRRLYNGSSHLASWLLHHYVFP